MMAVRRIFTIGCKNENLATARPSDRKKQSWGVSFDLLTANCGPSTAQANAGMARIWRTTMYARANAGLARKVARRSSNQQFTMNILMLSPNSKTNRKGGRLHACSRECMS